MKQYIYRVTWSDGDIIEHVSPLRPVEIFKWNCDFHADADKVYPVVIERLSD